MIFIGCKNSWSLSLQSKAFAAVQLLSPSLCDPIDRRTQAPLSFTISQSLFKLMSIESVMSSNHLILCHPILLLPSILRSFPGDPGGKESACNTGDPGSAPGLGRSSGEGKGNPLQYSCLENPMDRGARRPTVYGVTKSRTRMSDFTFTC